MKAKACVSCKHYGNHMTQYPCDICHGVADPSRWTPKQPKSRCTQLGANTSLAFLHKLASEGRLFQQVLKEDS